VNLLYNPNTAGGPLIPANGTSQSYTVITAGTMPGQVPQNLVLSTLDPLNNQYSFLLLDPSNPNTNAAGAQFQWSTTSGPGGTGVFTITAAPNSTITGPGTTQTNIGTVSNPQLVSAVNQINSINQGAAQSADARYVGTTLLLLTPELLPGAIVTAAVAANPDALPNTTFNSMSQAGRVAKLRLMELRDDGIGRASAHANGQETFRASGDPDEFENRTCARDQLSPAADTVNQPMAVDAGINGATPDQGARVWGRGYGFYEDVSGQSYAQGDYSAAMGGMMFGADVSLEGGLLAGAFAGFTPGDLSIQSTLGNTQVSLMGLNFGGYASWSPESGASYLQGYAMAGYSAADQSRNILIPGLVRTATSSANVWGAMLGGEGGLNLKLGERAVLQPYLGLEYGYYTRNGYSESGAGSLNLSVSSQDANLLQPTGGARVMQSFDVGNDRLTPYVGAAFVAQVPLGSWTESATNGFSGAQVFTYSEGADDQYGASFEAGLEFATSNRWTAYISFNGMAMTDTTVFGGQIGINIPF
jgi:outer membrane autotransporter protein